MPKPSACNDDRAIVVATFCWTTVRARPRRPPTREKAPLFVRWRDHDPSRIALSHITATSGGVHGATTWSCLIAPPSFLLLVAAGFLRAGSDAVNMTSITPATDKNLRAAASTQKHSARNFIDTCGSASPALRITALCVYQFWQYSALRPLTYLFTIRWPPPGPNSKEPPYRLTHPTTLLFPRK